MEVFVPWNCRLVSIVMDSNEVVRVAKLLIVLDGRLNFLPPAYMRSARLS